MSTTEEDVELLAEALSDLLQGELKINMKSLGLMAALKRQGKNTEWKLKGVIRYVEEHGDAAIPLLGGALAHQGLDRFLAWAKRKHPEEFAKAADAEVRDEPSD